MGSGIAAACVKRELPTTITDSRPESLAVGVQKVLEEVSYNKTHARCGSLRRCSSSLR